MRPFLLPLYTTTQLLNWQSVMVCVCDFLLFLILPHGNAFLEQRAGFDEKKCKIPRNEEGKFLQQLELPPCYSKRFLCCINCFLLPPLPPLTWPVSAGSGGVGWVVSCATVCLTVCLAGEAKVSGNV